MLHRWFRKREDLGSSMHSVCTKQYISPIIYQRAEQIFIRSGKREATSVLIVALFYLHEFDLIRSPGHLRSGLTVDDNFTLQSRFYPGFWSVAIGRGLQMWRACRCKFTLHLNGFICPVLAAKNFHSTASISFSLLLLFLDRRHNVSHISMFRIWDLQFNPSFGFLFIRISNVKVAESIFRLVQWEIFIVGLFLFIKAGEHAHIPHCFIGPII